MYKVYIETDDENRITAINSSAFLSDPTDWTQIGEGDGDRYHHAQGNYLDKPLCEEHGIPQYKYIDGAVVERTQSEIDADIAAIPPPEPTPQDDTDVLLADHEERLIYMELGV